VKKRSQDYRTVEKNFAKVTSFFKNHHQNFLEEKTGYFSFRIGKIRKTSAIPYAAGFPKFLRNYVPYPRCDAIIIPRKRYYSI